MSCMCGDTHCSSCGPAQGNSRCPICRSWMDDCCEHFDEETSQMKPEFVDEAKRLYEEELKADEAYNRSLSEDPPRGRS